MEFFGKRIASRDISGYYLLYQGEFAYNKSTSGDAPWGAVKRLDRYENGAVSTLYITFAIKDSEQTDSDFLACYYDTDLWHKGVQAVAAEGARNHGLLNIAPADFFNTTLMVPSNIEEQKTIGSVLNKVDNLIALHQCKFSLWFNSYRGNKITHSQISIAAPWEQRKLGDCMATVTDYVAAGSFADLAKNVQYNNEPDYAQLIRTVDLKHNFSNNGFIYVNRNAFDYLWRVNLNKECIVLPNIGANIGEAYYVEPTRLPYENNVLGPNAIFLEAEDNAYFFFSQFQTKAFQKNLSMSVASSGQPKFNKTELKEISLSVPNSEEQDKVGKLFYEIDNLITLHQRKCDELKLYKKGLLQKMFV